VSVRVPGRAIDDNDLPTDSSPPVPGSTWTASEINGTGPLSWTSGGALPPAGTHCVRVRARSDTRPVPHCAPPQLCQLRHMGKQSPVHVPADGGEDTLLRFPRPKRWQADQDAHHGHRPPRSPRRRYRQPPSPPF
jgi:hypothetical protein